MNYVGGGESREDGLKVQDLITWYGSTRRLSCPPTSFGKMVSGD